MARTIVGTDRRSQFPIQFEDEGVDLGTQGSVEEIDFVGAGVTVSRVDNTLTVTIPGGGGGATNLGYVPAATDGLVTSDTGTDATLPAFTNTDAGLVIGSGGGTTNFLRADGTWAAPPGGGTKTFSAGITCDGAGAVLTVGTKGYVTIPFTGTITGWYIVGDQSGSIVMDVWKAAGALPTNANTITGTEKPTLTAQTNNSDTALSTWTTAVTVGDIMGFEIESVSTLTKVNLVIAITQ